MGGLGCILAVVCLWCRRSVAGHGHEPLRHHLDPPVVYLYGPGGVAHPAPECGSAPGPVVPYGGGFGPERHALLPQWRAGGAERLRGQFRRHRRERRHLSGQIQLAGQRLFPRPARRGAGVVGGPQRGADPRRYGAAVKRRRAGVGGAVELRRGRCQRPNAPGASRATAGRRPLCGSALSRGRRC
jgi:hypothetical protein